MQFFSLLSGVRLLTLLVILAVSGPVAAQPADAPPAAEVLTTKQLENLITTLENEEQRTQFLGTLKDALQAQKAAAPVPGSLGTRVLGGLSTTIASVSSELAHLAGGAARLPSLAMDVKAKLDSPAERAAFLNALIAMAVVATVGVLAAWLAKRLLRRPAAVLKARPGARWDERIALVIGRVILALLPPVALAVAAWGVLPLLGVSDRLMTGLTTFIAALAVYHAVVGVARTLLAPDDETQRVLPFGAETGQYLMIWVHRFAAVVLLGGFVLQAAALAGLPQQSYAVLLKLLGLLVASLAAILILQNRTAVGTWLRRDTATPLPGERTRRPAQRVRQRFADIWHVLAVVYIIGLYVVWAAEIAGGFTYILKSSALTAMILILAAGLSHAIRLSIARAFRISAENQARFPGLEDRANRYVPVLHTILRFALVLITVLAVLEVWGLETLTWLTAGPGQRLTGAVLSIAMVLTLAFVAWSIVSSTIERYLSQTDEDGTVIARSARAKTLLPLARTVFLVVLVVIVGLIVLSEVGVNIAPLLAGAGVIGLAIGFGSQKLVQDVITGAFILIEDTISVGDVVNVGGFSGTVEAISIRSLRLRDASGSVHSIPFSTVDKVTNLTKEFSYAILDVGVAYREDTDDVFAVMTEVAEGMRSDPEWAPLILEPIEVQGVDAFLDFEVMLKARIKTLPIKQWAVRREFNRRLKKAFDARGIEIPFPQSTVWFGEDKNGNAPAGRVEVRHQGRVPAPVAPTVTPEQG